MINENSLLGRSFNNLEIEKTLKSLNGNYFMHESEDLIDQVNYLIEGKTIGWFQGKRIWTKTWITKYNC